MIEYKGNFAPAIVTVASGTYLCPGWIPVPSNTTRNDIKWIRPLPPKIRSFNVAGSNGKTTYKVTNINDRWSCDCTGFKFHKRCKHITHVQEEKVSCR